MIAALARIGSEVLVDQAGLQAVQGSLVAAPAAWLNGFNPGDYPEDLSSPSEPALPVTIHPVRGAYGSHGKPAFFVGPLT
jgi:hypothetical protein